MFKALKIQFQKLHSISEELVHRAVEKGKITADQYEEIVGEKYSVPMAEIQPAEKEEPKMAELTPATPVKGVEG